MPDLHQYLSLPAYGIAVTFYSVLCLYSGKAVAPKPYSKPLGFVLMIHAAFLSTVLLLETALLLVYASLPGWLTSQHQAGVLHFSFAGAVGICTFFGATSVERRIIFAKNMKISRSDRLQ